MEHRSMIGTITPVAKGDWDVNASYNRLNIVAHDNATYIAKKDVPPSVGIENTEYWQLLVNGGAVGVPTITIDDSQIVSRNPLTIELTDEQKEIIVADQTMLKMVMGGAPQNFVRQVNADGTVSLYSTIYVGMSGLPGSQEQVPTTHDVYMVYNPQTGRISSPTSRSDVEIGLMRDVYNLQTGKADASSVYTKSEVDAAVASVGKPDKLVSIALNSSIGNGGYLFSSKVLDFKPYKGIYFAFDQEYTSTPISGASIVTNLSTPVIYFPVVTMSSQKNSKSYAFSFNYMVLDDDSIYNGMILLSGGTRGSVDVYWQAQLKLESSSHILMPEVIQFCGIK